jgi:hypothetical protein
LVLKYIKYNYVFNTGQKASKKRKGMMMMIEPRYTIKGNIHIIDLRTDEQPADDSAFFVAWVDAIDDHCDRISRIKIIDAGCYPGTLSEWERSMRRRAHDYLLERGLIIDPGEVQFGGYSDFVGRGIHLGQIKKAATHKE